MARVRSAPVHPSHRHHWWAARLTTVFGIAIASLASCQHFHPKAPDPRGLALELADVDACLDSGGAWSADTHRCVSRVDVPDDATRTWRE
ncbi:hypothetical protein [Luteibacter sp. UNCMF366Tsu5.1]|uniref:hypothetical protein n=1 Tax=Luteibacter sp. UNCMF366Tsu5.1 TaxID=1502758 RepID=UPI000908B3CE|nr:hypothetical protein [Luteibacter sp. UNCMF366Tsu5.1]SFW55042.1 hypothetical protein SAMN02800691_2077 [Luteibacter sp. UNCMF366Tsu5.1]